MAVRKEDGCGRAPEEKRGAHASCCKRALIASCLYMCTLWLTSSYYPLVLQLQMHHPRRLPHSSIQANSIAYLSPAAVALVCL
jgi:hypothetical protein